MATKTSQLTLHFDEQTAPVLKNIKSRARENLYRPEQMALRILQLAYQGKFSELYKFMGEVKEPASEIEEPVKQEAENGVQ